MRGRMVGMYSFMWLGMYGIGGQLAGFVSDAWSLTGVILIGGLTCAALGLVLIAVPGMTQAADSSLGIDPFPA